MSALIVTAAIGPADLAWLDGLRRRHFPVDRNQLTAHLTLFHALPPSHETEAREMLRRAVVGRRPGAVLSGLMFLGRGVAFAVRSAELSAIRDDIADHFHGSLTAQDQQGWRAHVTIQNKVMPTVAKTLYEQLNAEFRPRPLVIDGLALHRYLGGPWQTLGEWRFRD